MAGSTVPERGLATSLNRIIRSREVGSLIEGLDRLGRMGRPGYGSRALVGVCIARSLYGLPTWTRVTRLVAEHQALRDALGAAPSVYAMYRFTGKLRRHWRLLSACIDKLIGQLGQCRPGFGRHVAIDSTDLPAFANGQRYRYKGGPEREEFSDPDASWGHRSAVSTRKGGGFYGYKLHLVACSLTGLPVAWLVRSGRDSDMALAEPLLDQLASRGVRAQTAAMDRGYDYRAVYRQCEERGVLPVVAARRNAGTGPGPIDRGSERFKQLYRKRAAVEREFGRLKHVLALTPLRCRGIERVQLHADLVVLTRLAGALV